MHVSDVTIEIRNQIERVRDHFIVNAQIGTKQFRLLLDTGASGILVLRSSAAETLALPPLGKTQVLGVQGLEEATYYVAEELKVGGLTLKNIKIHAVPEVKGDCDGVIGADVFGEYRITIDTDAATMMLSAGKQQPLPAGAVEVPFLHKDILLPIRIEGEEVWAMIDSGSSRTVLSLALAKKITTTLPEDRKVVMALDTKMGFGVTNPKITLLLADKDLEVNLLDTQTPVEFTGEFFAGLSFLDERLSPVIACELGAIIGADFLCSFKSFTIDYRGHKLILVPRTSTSTGKSQPASPVKSVAPKN